MNDKTGNDVGLNDVTSMSPQLKWMTQKPCGLYTQSHHHHKVGCGTWIWRVYIYTSEKEYNEASVYPLNSLFIFFQ
jgi:hypothetical protein